MSEIVLDPLMPVITVRARGRHTSLCVPGSRIVINTVVDNIATGEHSVSVHVRALSRGAVVVI